MAQGVFSLLEVRAEQVKNIANGNFASWSEGATYGYFSGGVLSTGTIVNTISRLDFFTDTANNPGKNLPSARSFLASTSSSFYGYFGGGRTDPTTIINNITRLDFSNETMSLPGNNLPGSRVGAEAVSSASYGYFGGGNAGAPTPSSLIFRLDFINETISNPGNLLSAQTEQVGFSDYSYGYFAGGTSNAGEGNAGVTRNSNIWRLDFSLETVSLLSANLSDAIRLSSGTSNESYGYFAGGETFGTPFGAGFSSINRLDLSTTISSKISNLPSTLFSSSASSNNSYGYFGGGNTNVYNTPTTTSNILRLDFSNETLNIDPARQLSSSVERLASVSGGQSTLRGKGFKTYGYFAGGTLVIPTFGANPTSNISRLDFSNDIVNFVANLPSEVSLLGTISSNFYGYFGGGSGTFSGSPLGSAISRIDFSNETTDISGFLPSARSNIGSTESSSYGYFAGSRTPGSFPSPDTVFSTITRFDFSTEISNNPDKNLTIARDDVKAFSNNFYGYFGGGTTVTSRVSTIERLDFSTETVTNPTNFSTGRSRGGSFSNSSYGYFIGGDDPVNLISTVTRLDFSNETLSNPNKNLLPARYRFGSTESSSYGYIGGGQIPGGPGTNDTATLNSLDFSTETVRSLSDTLPNTYYDIRALSNSN